MAKTKNTSTHARRLLLKGGTVVTMNPAREVIQGDVYVEGDRIRGVGAGAAGRKKVDEVVDCTGKLVIPGLIQPHTHLCQTMFRGYADDLELLEWLDQRIWPFEAAHSHESLFVSSMLGGVELLRGGTTAILDMGTVGHTDAVFEACKKLGLRATIGKAMMDHGQGLPAGLRESTDASLAESLALAERWHGAEDGRLRYAFAPRFVLSCTEELLTRVVKEARARGLMMHTHASENANEIAVVRERCGADNVLYLHGLGMSGPDTVYAHCVWVTAAEQRVLADTGTTVVHCPSSNMKLGSGFARVPDLLGLGINVALAADGAPCNNNLDQFMEMRLCGLIHKPRFGATAMPARTVFEMATLRGARALMLEHEIGSLEPGKKADVVVVDPHQLYAAPFSDPYSVLVYALGKHDVEHVFVDGICRVKGGKVAGVNAKRLVAQANLHAERIVRPLI
ncbi:MAG: 5'-deoxyadenosine deaminase [Myxococcales bacterium]|nr:5'-deoxyadenosine deaminase [Myxococcales bacterium]